MADKRIRIILDKTQAQRNAKELDQGVQSIGKSADKTQFQLSKLAVAITAAISVASLRNIADMVQSYQAMSERVRMATSSTEEFEMVQARLNATANATYRSLEEAQELYLRTSSALKGMGYQTGQALDVIDSMSFAFVRNATSADKANSAISAFGKAVSKGKVEADAWESILVAIPTVVENIASATGKTENAIRSLGASGKLSIQDLTEGLRKAREENKALADGMAVNLTDAGVRVRNALTQVFVKLEENTGAIASFTKLVVDAADAIAEFAGDSVKMQEVMDTASTIAEALAIVIGSRLAASILLAGKNTLVATAETVRYQATLASMAGVSTGAAAAQTALAVAARAAGSAMALFGGPLGVVLVAASALIYYSSKANDASTANDLLRRSVKDLTAAQAKSAELSFAKEIEKQETLLSRAADEIKLYQGRLNSMIELGKQYNIDKEKQAKHENEMNEKLIEAKGRYDDISQTINKLKDRIIELRHAQSGITYLGPNTQNSASTDEVNLVPPTEDKKDDTGQREIAGFKAGTQSLLNELNLRRQISDIYRQQALADDQSYYQQQLAAQKAKEAEELANLEARAAEDRIRRDEQFRQALENEKIQDEERDVIKQEKFNQDLLAWQVFQEQQTAIQEQGKKAREDLDRAEWQARLANAGAFGNALMQLGQGQSKKIFKIGQTLALAQAAVALPAAVMESFKNGGGYPWGLVPAGIMLATGLKNIRDIKNAGAGLGGGGGGSTPNISLPGGGGSSPTIPNTASTTELTQQRRVIDLRGVKADDKITVSALAALLEDDGAIVAIEGARQDAERRNVIGVTAR